MVRRRPFLLRAIAIRAAVCLLMVTLAKASTALPKDSSLPVLRWAEGQSGCTFSRDKDGKYRYALWTDDYGIILAVDAQELQLVHRRVEPFFSVNLTVRYRGKGTLSMDPGKATLEFSRHFKVVQWALDPEEFARQTQDDADELEHQTQREIEKHPEKREEREKYVQTFQKEAAEFQEFLTERALPPVELDSSRAEVSGWILFSVKNKWLGPWKKPEEFVLRIPIGDRLAEFPFSLPAQGGDLILRQR